MARKAAFRDWNTFSAKLKEDGAAAFHPRDRVRGHHLSQPFVAPVSKATEQEPGWTALELDLDEAVDVVAFDSFSSLRNRLRGVIGPEGRSWVRTSTGRAHFEVEV